MITIDGSRGEGGGQILRTSLSLSLATRTPFRIENIRARREKPGLLRQHLTAVQAAAAIGDAIVDGDVLGSKALTFTPRALRTGDHSFAIGTAGSTTVVLQTILLPLLLAAEPSTIEIEGGTHNVAAPPFDFLQHAFLPLLRADVDLMLIRPGFYPAGGGRIRAEILPSRLGRIELESRGALVNRRIRAVVANLPLHIAEREVRVAAEILGWPAEGAESIEGAHSPGNFVAIVVEFENVTEVFTAFGARGIRAEDVARSAATEAQRYLATEAAVGEHLADQLLLPMALGEGGSFTTTTPLTEHTTTNIETIGHFLDRKITTEAMGEVTRIRID